jgi:hypothetical protein
LISQVDEELLKEDVNANLMFIFGGKAKNSIHSFFGVIFILLVHLHLTTTQLTYKGVP